LRPATEFQISLCRDKDDGQTIVAEVERMKDGEDGLRLASKLKVVELGKDNDGDPVSSCVVVPAEVPSKAVKLTERERGAIDALEAAKKDEKGRVTVEAWRAQIYKDEVLDKDAANDREDWSRLKKGLIKKERIKMEDVYVYHVDDCDGGKSGKR
jgi:5-hydroxyisourate hydrolase-like protein (transthyretin family)